MEVYRALFLEYAYRNLPPKAGKSFHQPPAWLIEGLDQDAAARNEGIATGVYEQLIKEESPPKLDTFLKERPEMLDATSRAIYRARALGLFRALLRTPDGAKYLAEYCSSLPSTNPADGAKLLEKFPALSEQPATLSKMWTLSLAERSASNRVMPLGVGETQKRVFSHPRDYGANGSEKTAGGRRHWTGRPPSCGKGKCWAVCAPAKG